MLSVLSVSVCPSVWMFTTMTQVVTVAHRNARKFGKCSAAVKTTSFRPKSYYLNMCDSALWYHYTSKTLNRLQTCYSKCIKILFGYSKRFSVTQMLFELRLPSFATVLLNGTTLFRRMWRGR